MKEPLKITLIIVFTILTVLVITDWILSRTYIVPVMSERTEVFNRGDVNDVREYLLQNGNDVEMDNYYTLINRNRADILEMMFQEFNLDPDYEKKYQYATPLFGAAKKFKPEIVSVLIKYGADVNYKDPYGMTPLIAASYTTFERENPASMAITKILVEAGADVNVVSEFGKTAIEGALFTDDVERVKYLVNQGGDINHLSDSGANYMFYCDYIECYEYFLSKGFDINSINYKGKSIFQGSHNSSSFPISLTKQLLAWGADICHKDKAGDTVLNYVERQRTGPHDQKENPEFYNQRVEENRASEMYKFLEKEYSKKCIN